jgi:diguanylate cyclase (GGDEF)-like protein
LIFQALQVPQLQAEASTDPKTGLANMRHFRHVTTQHLEQAHRRGQSLSLLMCDLDYLRDINNTYGHHAGDIVLNGIADIIRRALRGHDCAARFGGEEFVILLIDTDRVDAYQLAECVRQDLEQARFDIGSQAAPIAATLSIGVATFPHDGATIEGLMRAADEAVYQAKWAGRNRVCVAGGTQSNHTDAGAGDNDSRVSVPQAVRYRSATTHGRTERR